MVEDGSDLVACMQLFSGIREPVVTFDCIYTAALLFQELVHGCQVLMFRSNSRIRVSSGLETVVVFGFRVGIDKPVPKLTLHCIFL